MSGSDAVLGSSSEDRFWRDAETMEKILRLVDLSSPAHGTEPPAAVRKKGQFRMGFTAASMAAAAGTVLLSQAAF